MISYQYTFSTYMSTNYLRYPHAAIRRDGEQSRVYIVSTKLQIIKYVTV